MRVGIKNVLKCLAYPGEGSYTAWQRKQEAPRERLSKEVPSCEGATKEVAPMAGNSCVNDEGIEPGSTAAACWWY